MGKIQPTTGGSEPADLDAAVAALRKDYSKLSARIRALVHTVICECGGVKLRLHFPAFRQSQPTIHELIDAIVHYLAPFALPRSQCRAVDEVYGKVDAEEFKLRYAHLLESAKSLFIRANRITNRNGEAGELLLYILTEWVIGAPQLIAKMSLKTNREMPVHGADGVHVRYSKEDGRLLLYWGEAKLYADVDAAITAAAESFAQALHPDKMKHEIELVQRNIAFSGLDPKEREALLRYLDPFDETYNERHDVTTSLIGFDFDGFAAVKGLDPTKAEEEFVKRAQTKLAEVAPKLAKALESNGLKGRPFELFLFPVPSVQSLRDIFQAKIGWKP